MRIIPQNPPSLTQSSQTTITNASEFFQLPPNHQAILFKTTAATYELGTDISANFTADFPFIKAYQLNAIVPTPKPREAFAPDSAIFMVTQWMDPHSLSGAQSRFVDETLSAVCTDQQSMYRIHPDSHLRHVDSLTNTTIVTKLSLHYPMIRRFSHGESRDIIYKSLHSTSFNKFHTKLAQSTVTLVPKNGELTAIPKHRFIKTHTFDTNTVTARKYIPPFLSFMRREGSLGKLANLGSKKTAMSKDGEKEIALQISDFIPGKDYLDWLNDNERDMQSVDTFINNALLLFSATSAFHRRGLIHRDIKPDNFMRSHCGTKMVLTDAGLSRVRGYNDESEYQAMDNMIGSRSYLAPELRCLGAICTSSIKTDIYALGVVCFVSCGSSQEAHHSSLSLSMILTSAQKNSLDKEHFTILNRSNQSMVAINPQRRPELCALKHAFYKVAYERVHGSYGPAVLNMINQAGEKAIALDTSFDSDDNTAIPTQFTVSSWLAGLNYTIDQIKDALNQDAWANDRLCVAHFVKVLDITALKTKNITRKEDLLRELDLIQATFTEAMGNLPRIYTETHLQERYSRFCIDSACDLTARVQKHVLAGSSKLTRRSP